MLPFILTKSGLNVNPVLQYPGKNASEVFYSPLELSNKILYTYAMNGTIYSSLHQIQKAFRKTLYTAKIPLSVIRSEYDDFFYSPHIPNNTDVSQETIVSVPVEILKPEVAAVNRGILYVHGGAFINGSCKAARNFCASFAHECTCRLFLPEYRLAPEYPFPAGLEDIHAVYQGMLKIYGISPQSMIIAGDEAGAALALALVHKLKEKKQALPAALVLISPWVDLTCSNEAMHTLRKCDKFLLKDALLGAAGRYTTADNVRNPFVSPLFGSFENFPPVFIQCGGKEILAADAEALAHKIEAAGGSVELDIWPDMWHFFQSMDAYAKEAHLAVEKMGQWVQSLFIEEA